MPAAPALLSGRLVTAAPASLLCPPQAKVKLEETLNEGSYTKMDAWVTTLKGLGVRPGGVQAPGGKGKGRATGTPWLQPWLQHAR